MVVLPFFILTFVNAHIRRRIPPCVAGLGHSVASVHVCETRNPARQNVLSALRGSWQGDAIRAPCLSQHRRYSRRRALASLRFVYLLLHHLEIIRAPRSRNDIPCRDLDDLRAYESCECRPRWFQAPRRHTRPGSLMYAGFDSR